MQYCDVFCESGCFSLEWPSPLGTNSAGPQVILTQTFGCHVDIDHVTKDIATCILDFNEAAFYVLPSWQWGPFCPRYLSPNVWKSHSSKGAGSTFHFVEHIIFLLSYIWFEGLRENPWKLQICKFIRGWSASMEWHRIRKNVKRFEKRMKNTTILFDGVLLLQSDHIYQLFDCPHSLHHHCPR